MNIRKEKDNVTVKLMVPHPVVNNLSPLHKGHSGCNPDLIYHPSTLSLKSEKCTERFR